MKPERKIQIPHSKLLFCWCLVFGIWCFAASAAASFVYETSSEFVSSGDFNGDGRVDALIVDKATGNARVGFQDADGALAWAPAMSTGVAHAGALAVGRFVQTNRDAIAVTSIAWNRVNILDLSNPTNKPVSLQPAHAGPSVLVGLEAPFGTVTPYGWLALGSQHDPGATLLDLFACVGDGLAQFQDQVSAEGYLVSANSLKLGTNATTYVAGMRRGSNDTFAAYSYATHTNVLYRVELSAGTEYAFGHFTWGSDNETTAGLLFYVPGESNITAQRVSETAGGFILSAPVTTAFAAAIQRVYFVNEGTNGFGIVQFGDSAIAIRPSGANDELQVTAGFAVDTAGNAITAFAPLGIGKFALLSGGSNTTTSAQSQVFSRSGDDYVQTSGSALPKTTSSGTRANVWLFASEPFVSSTPTFIASLTGGDWITSISGLPGTVSVVAETDGGVTDGLGNPTSQNLGSAPNNAPYGIASQYHPTISLFSYASARAAQLIQITISPPAGTYPDPIDITFPGRDPTDHVYYRVGAAGAFQEFGAPFTISSNAQVQYYATRFGYPDPTPLETASYTITGGVVPPLNTNTNGGGTNVPPPAPTFTNTIATYAYGTIVYGRTSGSTGSIWAIHLDGSGDRYITEGVRPRLSPDGQYLAFAREDAAYESLGNLWIRDLRTGNEWRLYENNDTMVFYDWDRMSLSLFFDYFCKIWRTDFDGNVVGLPMVNDCFDDAPSQNPLDLRLAFHNLNQNTAIRGLYVAPPDGASRQRLNVAATLFPRFPAWSPDGELLSFASGTTSGLNSGQNLWIVKPDGSAPHQITAFTITNGFRYGALWSPAGDALIGAGTVGNVNGIWIVPLTAGRDACASPPIRLPTTPGDGIDFVGTVFVPPPPPKLTIHREGDNVTVSWPLTAWLNILEATPDSLPAATWTPKPPPFALTNGMLEHRIPAASLQPMEFFRLKAQ